MTIRFFSDIGFKRSFASLLFFVLVVTLTPIDTAFAQKITPGASCKLYMQKVIYQDLSYLCIKSGKKLVWSKGIALKPTSKPTSIPTSIPTPVPTSVPTPEVPYSGLLAIERDLYLKMDAIIMQWAPYLSALENNNVRLSSENPAHPRNEDSRLGVEVSFEILGKILPKMVAPSYYTYETAEWADKEMSVKCPYLVGQNPTGNTSGANAGCGKLIISNLNGWMNNIEGSDGTWFEAAHETFHIAQWVAGVPSHELDKSLSYPYHPAWYREGSSSTFGGLVRSLMSKGKYSYGDLNSFEKSPISYSDCNKAWNYWHQSNSATSSSELGHCEYGLGRRMTDYLVAWHGGVEAILTNYQYVAEGKSFEEAFELSHGITVSDFFIEVKPFLANQGFLIP